MISRHQLGNAYPIKKLESIVEFLDHRRRPVTESDRKPGPYPYYGANGQQGWIDNFLFDEPLVLLAEDGGHFDNPERGVAYLVNGKTWVNNHAHVLRPSNEIDVKFLCRVLENYDLSPFITGTTRGKLTKGGAAEIPVPVPPLEEQRRIAAILDQAETLRTQRRTALALLDSLTQSLFLDMFGDPVANPKGWQRLPLSALVEKIDSGWSPVCLDRRAEEGEWAVLKLGAITSCEFKPQENKALPPDIAPVESIEVKPGDLLFSRKNTYELVAACALVNQTPARLMMSDLIFRFRLNASSAVIPQYLHRLLTYATKRQEVQKLAGGSAGSMPNISKAKLLDFLIEVPPLPLQKTFATRIASIEALKTTHRHALAALDALFASLQQRAFTGAL